LDRTCTWSCNEEVLNPEEACEGEDGSQPCADTTASFARSFARNDYGESPDAFGGLEVVDPRRAAWTQAPSRIAPYHDVFPRAVDQHGAELHHQMTFEDSHCSSSGYCSVWIPVIVMQQPIFYNTQHVADSEQTMPASTHGNNEQVAINSSSQIAPLRWYLREKEICPRECRARSPSFAMTLPEHPTDISFSLMIDPYLSRRFRQPAYGSIKVKCESDLKKMIHCTKTQITVHVGGEIRGPFIHDFSSIAVFELPRGQDKWNLTAAVDATSKCIPIMVQVVPMPSAVSCSGCVSDVVDSAPADSSHADSSENQCQDDLQSDSGSQWIGDALASDSTARPVGRK
jgi:hypothetical protein